MRVIEVEQLRKEYRSLTGRKTVAVAGLDLSVPEGGVFGFLGPNGSGKTTTIRCLLGLVRPSAGRSRVLGADSQRHLGSVISRVGAIVETPAFYPNCSGRRNLGFLASLRGISDERVDAVLERVGLGDRGRDPFRAYSLGMKQRLGLAAALLQDPDVLLLDEPANGLDPAGIVEIRELIRSLGEEGRTVFVSSHLLGEVQQMCDRVAILNHGQCIAQGTVDEVLASGGAAQLVVRVDEPERAREVLERAGIPATPEQEHLVVDLSGTDGARVSRALAEAGLYPHELSPRQVDLETVFLRLTEGDTSG
ncbi:MAG: ABC transporter ATP-binding protein [Acidimicrobiia bacterium]|nr:ABC transporter ATP-binding protein [Acidimicrobiia bacterium]